MNLDFNPAGQRGFYLTDDLPQAQAWARKKFGDNGAIVEFSLGGDALRNLDGKSFGGASPEWADFVRGGRSGTLHHGFDFVEGPMLKNPQTLLRGGPPQAFGYQFAIFTQKAVSVLDNATKRILMPR